MKLTHAQLLEWFAYDPETGVFMHRINRGKIKAGTVAGKMHNQGYQIITVSGKGYLAHRLAWFYMTAQWPANDVDHIDLNRLNNKFSNLRDVTRQVNQQNAIQAKASNKSSGLLGVSLCRQTGRWAVQIRINGKKRHIGRFDTPELGYAAYLAAKREFHPGNTL